MNVFFSSYKDICMSKEEMLNIIRKVCEELNISRFKFNVFLKFNKRVDCYAMVHINDDFCRPREFVVVFSSHYFNKKSENKKLLIKTIIHEFTHIKQWLRGEYRIYERKPSTWKGKVFDDDVDYTRLPHEKEAFKMENILYRKIVLNEE